MLDEAINDLSAAIVMQAIRDWRFLCKGGPQGKWCNFKELEHFFKHGCGGYVSVDLAERIWRMMQRERRARNAV